MLDVFFADFPEIEASFDWATPVSLHLTDALLFCMRDAMQLRITSASISKDIYAAQQREDEDGLVFHEERRQAFLPTLRTADLQVAGLLKKLQTELETVMPSEPLSVRSWTQDVTQALDISFDAIHDLSKMP